MKKQIIKINRQRSKKAKIVLITGGAGFIGSHLCDYLMKNDYSIICLDNLITGSMDNIKQHLKSSKFKFIKHDISKPIKIQGAVDYILHFASPASPKDYDEFPIQTLKAGALGTHNALGIARAKKAGFLLASTSEIYGDPLVSPQKESYWGNVNSIGLRSCYDEAKRFAEAITMTYYRKHGIDIRIVRIFNTYGPRMRKNDGRVIPNFISQLLARRPLTIFGKGEQTRSFCYVSDLVRGIVCLMRKKNFLADEQTRIFNLGNPEEITINELTQILFKVFKIKITYSYGPLPQDDPRQRKPDIHRAIRDLGWRPKVKIEDGLKKTYSWFRDN